MNACRLFRNYFEKVFLGSLILLKLEPYFQEDFKLTTNCIF